MVRGWKDRIAVVLSCSLLTAASAQDWEGREMLGSTLWMQRAPEFRAIAEQTYRLASQQIAAPAPGSAAGLGVGGSDGGKGSGGASAD